MPFRWGLNVLSPTPVDMRLPSNLYLHDASEETKAVALNSAVPFCRLAQKGNPDLFDILKRIDEQPGNVVDMGLLNETNLLPVEHWTQGPDKYRELYDSTVTARPGKRIWYSAPSPTFEGWEAHLKAAAGVRLVQLHVYGRTLQEMMELLERQRALVPDALLALTEVNPGYGPGRVFNLNEWGPNVLLPFMEWAAKDGYIEFLHYFALDWQTPDTPGASKVDAKGTEVERIMYTFRIPTVTPPKTEPPEKPKEEKPKVATLGDMLLAKMQKLLPGRVHDYRTKVRHGSGRNKYVFADSRKMPFSVIHHSESPRSTTPESIDNYHVTTHNWPGIGYHGVIRMGAFYLCSELDVQRAHIAERNDEGLGWCVTGDYTDVQPASEDIAVLAALAQALDELYGHQKRHVGHRELMGAGYLCPARLLPFWKDIRTRPALDFVTVRLPVPDAYTGAKLGFVTAEAARDARDEFKLPGVHDYIVEHLLPAVQDVARRSSKS